MEYAKDEMSRNPGATTVDPAQPSAATAPKTSAGAAPQAEIMTHAGPEGDAMAVTGTATASDAGPATETIDGAASGNASTAEIGSVAAPWTGAEDDAPSRRKLALVEIENSRAPVKLEYLVKDLGPRVRVEAVSSATGQDGDVAMAPKLSKRQQKKQRQQQQQLNREKQAAEGGKKKPTGLVDETNFPHNSLLFRLRRSEYQFARSDAVLKEMGISKTHATREPKSQAKPVGDEDAGGQKDEGVEKEAGDGEDDAAADGEPPSKKQKTDEFEEAPQPVGPAIKRERKPVDFKGKTVLAPLTTVGNLPFRRLCKKLGADITVSEMALATKLLQGSSSEWALVRRHRDEDMFGVQLAGGYADALATCAECVSNEMEVDFVDINCGCPIDLVVNKGAGSALMRKLNKLEIIAKSVSKALGQVPLTLKLRMGYEDNNPVAHTVVPKLASWGVSAVTLHGRSREQRYSKAANWEYIWDCAKSSSVPLIGNGDICDFEDQVRALTGQSGAVSSVMVARGALYKPWVFKEIKDGKRWDISSSERLDLLKDYASFGMEHWGADSRGVENTRKFMLEWLSYTCRYIPVGLLEVNPQKLQWRNPSYSGRNDLETLMASENPVDWVKLSEMVLGPAPPGFTFHPKHKSSAHAKNEHELQVQG